MSIARQKDGVNHQNRAVSGKCHDENHKQVLAKNHAEARTGSLFFSAFGLRIGSPATPAFQAFAAPGLGGRDAVAAEHTYACLSCRSAHRLSLFQLLRLKSWFPCKACLSGICSSTTAGGLLVALREHYAS